MKDVTDIFIVDEEGALLLNKKELRTIPVFKEMLGRDKGGKIAGDVDGRYKKFVYKEMMYIYLFCNPSSIYRDLADKVKHEKSVELATLPSGWKPDSLIKEGMTVFVDLLDMSALYHSYINANKGVYSLGEDLKFFNTLRDKIRKNIQIKMKELEATGIEEDIQRLEKEIDYATNSLMDMGNKITTLSNSLPSAFETVEKLKAKLVNESQGGGKLYGGGELGNREK